ncbi:MAG: 4-(cytidine 5'-diphospho)-2-C-methyl-D-erythritol kinase [Rhodoferax sp.]|nr:4-(cytidine 5'-diphospho)-2-C-methyl-D-erythritol kinase [Rhodoferax sp.]
MNTLYDVAAPGKLNLFLHITGRRADGYHLLQSAFALIDWCDTLHFELRSDDRISREDLTLGLPADDLIVRAAKALQVSTGTRQGVHIGVLKRIPTQAGMGGGSSDAASCLLALNRLWKLQLTLPELARIGMSLGADVPFFLAGRNAWVEGVGEHIVPIDLAESFYLVAKPPQGLSTAAIFADPALKRDTTTATIAGFAKDQLHFGHNDLQPVAQRLCAGVTEGLAWLASQGLQGRMTGSGSAVFAGSPICFEASNAPPGFEQRWCQGLATHPLLGWAAGQDLPVRSN